MFPSPRLHIRTVASAQKDLSAVLKQFICDGSALLQRCFDKRTPVEGTLGGGICTFLAWLQRQLARAALPAISLQM